MRRIGAGGMAEVFKCRLSGIGGFDKLVVVKRIRPELAADPHFVDMFLDEARIAANLSHSNIIQIYEIDEVAGLPYIAMEYLRGPTLSMLIRQMQARDKQSFAVAAKVMSGICSALDYAHNAADESGACLGIIHRDVTPQNILISLDGVPKLLDFGVAKAHGQIAHTSAGSIKGKFKFMAPEAFLGDKTEITRALDVFAAGVCLYQATTFRLPYEGEGELDVMRAAASGKFPRPSELVPGFCPRMEEIILGAMAPQVKDRCPDALTLHKQLEEYAQQRGCTQSTVVEHLRGLFPDDPAYEPGGVADIQSSDIVVTPPPRPSQPVPLESRLVSRSAVLWGSAAMPLSAVRSSSVALRPKRITVPMRPVDDDRSVEIDVGDLKRRHKPKWLLAASLAVLVIGIGIGGFAAMGKASLPVAVAVPVPAPPQAIVTPAAVAPAPIPVVTPAPKPAPPDFSKTLAAARAAMDQGKHVEAATLARQVLAVQIDEPTALALLKDATEAIRRVKVSSRPPPVKNGGLTIETDPIAQVFLNGKLLGFSPIRRQVLPEGVYQVGARHARREPVVQDVKVIAGRETMLTLQLAERPRVVRAPPPPPPKPEPAPEPEAEEEEVAPPPPKPEPAPAAPPPVVAAPPKPAPVVERPSPSPQRRAVPPGLSFECPDAAHLVYATPPEGAQAWCETHDGEKHGRFVRLYSNGRKAEEGEYRRGKKHGRWLDFYEQGGERGRVEWRKGVQSW